jgi:hypothetical protein
MQNTWARTPQQSEQCVFVQPGYRVKPHLQKPNSLVDYTALDRTKLYISNK